MNIKKYKVKEHHKFMRAVYEILDETDKFCVDIEMKSMNSNIVPFRYRGSLYELKRVSILSSIREIYKDGVLIATLAKRSTFSYDFLIEMNDKTYSLDSNWSFKDISVKDGKREVGKVSRKTNWFKSNFGIALSDELDPIVLMMALFLQLAVMRAAMAA